MCYPKHMSAAERLLSEVLSLPESERAKIVHELLGSLEAAPEDDIDAAWAAEIERRVEEVRTGAVQSVPWEQAHANILDELEKRRAARSTP